MTRTSTYIVAQLPLQPDPARLGSARLRSSQLQLELELQSASELSGLTGKRASSNVASVARIPSKAQTGSGIRKPKNQLDTKAAKQIAAFPLRRESSRAPPEYHLFTSLSLPACKRKPELSLQVYACVHVSMCASLADPLSRSMVLTKTPKPPKPLELLRHTRIGSGGSKRR